MTGDLRAVTRDELEAEAGAIAEETRVFVDGAADAGANPELVRRARLLADTVVELIDTLQAERSARVAIQAARDRAIAVLERQAGLAAAGTTPAELAAAAAVALLVERDAEFGDPDDDLGGAP